ncbi:MAG: biliverdin-producing heme oxygenase [Phycisphaerales bacterium]
MTTGATTDERPLTQRLREDNADLHAQAEHDALPQAMVKGEIARDAYVELLGQLWVVNKALDEAIEAVRGSTPAVRDLVKDHQLQEANLRADLAHYGVDPASIEVTPAARAFLDDVERSREGEPLRLLGLHYVREGANNGNKFIAMKLRKTWGVEGADGFRHLDPYGNEQRPLWEAWKAELAGYEFTEAEKATILAGARSMFEHIMAVNRSVTLD